MGRSRLVAAHLLLALALLATACGGDADVDAGDDPATTSRAPDPDPVPDPPTPWAELTFAVQIQGPDAATTTYGLTCLDDDATAAGDPTPAPAAEMCRALGDEAVAARLIDGPGDRICTEIYGGPQLARVTGSLLDATIDTEVRRNDGCGIADWDLLAALLPAPL